jgi:GNAT superfamily N-acetyltransferase
MDSNFQNTADRKIRIATIQDVPTIVRQRHAMFAETGFSEASLAEMDQEARLYFARAIEAGTYHHWFIERDGHVAASTGVSVTPFYPGPRDPRPQRAWILNVYTEPRYRKQGMASQLMGTAIDWCRGNGLRTVYLHATDFGRPLYERLGFVSSTEMRLDLEIFHPLPPGFR